MRDNGDRDSNTEELYAGLEQIYAQIKGRSRRLWPADRLAEDLSIDSIAGLELMVTAEDQFGIELFDDPRVRRLATVADLVVLIAQCRTEGPALADPAQTDPAQAEPAQAEPAQAEQPVRAEPAFSDAEAAEPGLVEAAGGALPHPVRR